MTDEPSPRENGDRARLRKALRQLQKRLSRRLEAIAQDAARAEEVPALRSRATSLLSHLAELAPDATVLETLDDTHEPPVSIRIAIDPELGPKRQAEAWFVRARRLERGARVAAERSAQTERLLADVEALVARVGDPGEEELVALNEEAVRLGARGLADTGPAGPGRPGTRPASSTGRKPRGATRRLPYRRFAGTEGREILVGRSARDNDALTVRHARPHDLFLHVRDTAGAHVIVPLHRNETCPPELLLDAATLATHFSERRNEPVVDVTYTPRRFVRKPKGTPAGLVLLDREKVLALRVEPERLARLLGAEIR